MRKYNKHNCQILEHNRQELYKELYDIMQREYDIFIKNNSNIENVTSNNIKYFCKVLKKKLNKYYISKKARHYKIIDMLEANSRGKYGNKHSLFLFNNML